MAETTKQIAQPEPDSKSARLRELREAAAAQSDNLGIPDFLRREDSPDARKRLDMIRAAAKRIHDNPARGIKNPRDVRQSTGLGMSPLAMQAAGAKLVSEQESAMSKKSKTKAKGASKSKARATNGRAAKSARKSAAGAVRAGSKLEIISQLLTRKEGCTTAEVLKATGWRQVSIPPSAARAGLKLRKEKDGSVTRYFGTASSKTSPAAGAKPQAASPANAAKADAPQAAKPAATPAGKAA